jgi:hypothetical protein
MQLKGVVSTLDLFQGRMSLSELLQIPIPFLNDLTTAQIDYLKEKKKAEEDAMKEQQRKRT